MLCVVCLWEHSLVASQFCSSFLEGIRSCIQMTFLLIVVRTLPRGLGWNVVDSLLRRWMPVQRVYHLRSKFTLFSVVVSAAILFVPDGALSIVPVALGWLEIRPCCFIVNRVVVELFSFSHLSVFGVVQLVHFLLWKPVSLLSSWFMVFHRRARVVQWHAYTVRSEMVVCPKSLSGLCPTWFLPSLVCIVFIPKNVWILIAGPCHFVAKGILPQTSDLVVRSRPFRVENVCVVFSALEIPSLSHI